MLKRIGISAAQNLLGSKAGPSKTTVLGKMTTNKSQARNMLFGRMYRIMNILIYCVIYALLVSSNCLIQQ
jgi:hypothetical protein